MIEHLTWDSDFFGYKVGRAFIEGFDPENINSIFSIAKLHGYKLIYIILNSLDDGQDVKLRSLGANLVDTKVTYVQKVNKVESTIDEKVISWINKPISDKLYSLSLQSGVYSRFFIDKKFTNNEFKKLYYVWLESSIKGQLAQDVLVYKDGSELGIITLGIKNNRADIGLLAVDENSRGKSVGTKLVNAAKEKTFSWGIKELQVVTQRENKIACKFYERQGFHILSTQYIYHFWL